MTKTVSFSKRPTPHGCTVEVVWPSGRKQYKRFRNGYACSKLSAAGWIREQINILKESIAIDNYSIPDVFVEGELVMSAAHGGKRDNAGRKPRDDGQGRTVPKSIKVSQEVSDYLSEHGTGIIEDMIRKSKAFKTWVASAVQADTTKESK